MFAQIQGLPKLIADIFFTVTGTFFCYWWRPHLHPKRDKHCINSTVHREPVIRKVTEKINASIKFSSSEKFIFFRIPFFFPQLLLCKQYCHLILYWENWSKTLTKYRDILQRACQHPSPKKRLLSKYTVSIAVTAGIPLTSCLAKNFVEQDFLLNSFKKLGRDLVVLYL